MKYTHELHYIDTRNNTITRKRRFKSLLRAQIAQLHDRAWRASSAAADNKITAILVARGAIAKAKGE